MPILPLLLCLALDDAIVRLDGSRVTAGEVDRRVAAAMERSHVHGLAVSVIQSGRVRYQKTFGFADAAAGRALHPDTVMYGASFTKAMFAYAAMSLAQEGKLDLNRPIAAYLKRPLPEYPRYADLAGDERWKKLTLGILLSHTSGFANFAFLEPDRKLRFHFEPGSRFAYSGEGINLAQFVLEDMGVDVGKLFQARAIDRFGMKRTGLVWREEFASDLAVGHLEDGSVAGHNQRRSVRAAGSMDTTPADMTRFALGIARRDGLAAKWWKALFAPRIRIRSATQFPSLNETVTAKNDAIRLSYALGWGVFQTPHGRAVFKEGHDDGWENHLVCFDKRRTCMLLMSNSANGDKTFRELLEFVIGDRYTPWEWEGYAY